MKYPDINASREELVSFFGLSSKNVYFDEFIDLNHYIGINHYLFVKGVLQNSFLIMRWEDYSKICFCVYFSFNNNFYSLHNEFGPASIIYYKSGLSIVINYYNREMSHRINGPAEILISLKTNMVESEKYYINGHLHNSVGPAVRIFEGNKWINFFWKHDAVYSFNDFFAS